MTVNVPICNTCGEFAPTRGNGEWTGELVHAYGPTTHQFADDRPDTFGRTMADLVAEGNPKHAPRKVMFRLADDESGTFRGYSDGSSWNGFDNVQVLAHERDLIVRVLEHAWMHAEHGTRDEFVSGIDELEPNEETGLFDLGYGYCTTIEREGWPE